VWKKGPALVPTFTAFATVRLLESHFGDLVDYAFTARMEDDLDRISNGDQETLPYLADFYFGTGTGAGGPGGPQPGGSRSAGDQRHPLGEDEGALVVRVGRYGPYLQVEGATVSIPEDLPPDELTPTGWPPARAAQRRPGDRPSTRTPGWRCWSAGAASARTCSWGGRRTERASPRARPSSPP